jgi:hypothetical protein
MADFFLTNLSLYMKTKPTNSLLLVYNQIVCQKINSKR